MAKADQVDEQSRCRGKGLLMHLEAVSADAVQKDGLAYHGRKWETGSLRCIACAATVGGW